MTYEFLQHYWWFLVSLLGALLVFLLFVQGANSMVFAIGGDEDGRRLVVNSTGRKWEFTFTTLVTFGGAFFASFPLFYSTSFGGAYWLWMAILFTFVVQAVSYEFQNKLGNLLGPRTFQSCLVLNGLAGPLLLGCAVATFFEGANFLVEKGTIVTTMGADGGMAAISRWGNASHGLDALLSPWVLLFGLAVVFLTRTLGILYLLNNIDDEGVNSRLRKRLLPNALPFVVLFVAWFVHLLLKDGYTFQLSDSFGWEMEEGAIIQEPHKYLTNMLTLWPVTILLVCGVLLVLTAIWRTATDRSFRQGIWSAGLGTVLTVLSLLLMAGWNNTVYYPSTHDPAMSLTIANSAASEFTLRTMFYVSLLIPFVLAYIFYCWRAIDSRPITAKELQEEEEKY